MSSESSASSEAEIINHSTADITNEEVPEVSEETIPQRPPTLSRASTASREKCWICLSTKDEDPPSPPNPVTEWRAPCSCSLQAHEQCLLDWVADQEAPRRRNGSSQTAPDKILCPQCRSEIKIQRPVDPAVVLCRFLGKQYSRLILPGIGASVVGTVFAGCWGYGRLATTLIFGSEHAQQVWCYAKASGNGRMASYALIPICLIFSGTSYADFVLPLGTVTLLSTQIPLSPTAYEQYISWDAPWWPPLPSTTFIVLPTVITAYDWLYGKAFGELHKKWLADVQPRQQEDYADRGDNIADVLNEAEQAQAEEAMEEGEVVFAVDINLGPIAVEVGAEGEAVGAQQNEDVGGPANGGAAQLNGDQNAPRNNAVGRVNEYITDTQKILGSLLLPIAANLAGEALRLVLPVKWTSPRWNYYASSGRVGFFATKWGRAVAGGLAFCFVKDMFMTYCRWRLADTHKKRKIMNFDKVNKRYIAP